MEARRRDLELVTHPGSPDAKRRARSGARRKVGAVDLAVAQRPALVATTPDAARLASRVEAARGYANGDVEVFERSFDPALGASRARVERWRPGPGGKFTLVETGLCHDTDVEIALLGCADDVARPLRSQSHGDALRIDRRRRSIVHPERGWQAAVLPLQPETVARLPRALIHDLGPRPRGFTLRMALASLPGVRHAQLRWLTDAVSRLGANARIVWVPHVERWVPVSEWREVGAHAESHPRTLLGLWTRVVRTADRWHTRGLSRWMLPELSVEAALPAATSVMRAWMLRLLEHDDTRRAERLGPEAPALLDHRFRLYDPARRTPSPISLVPLPTSFRADPNATEGAWRVRVVPPVDPALATRWGTVQVERA